MSVSRSFVSHQVREREERKGKLPVAAMHPERMERETKREREGCGHWATGPPCRRGCNEEEDGLPSTIRSLWYKERLGFNEICFDGVHMRVHTAHTDWKMARQNAGLAMSPKKSAEQKSNDECGVACSQAR